MVFVGVQYLLFISTVTYTTEFLVFVPDLGLSEQVNVVHVPNAVWGVVGALSDKSVDRALGLSPMVSENQMAPRTLVALKTSLICAFFFFFSFDVKMSFLWFLP